MAFDPVNPSLRERLLTAIGTSLHSTFEPLQGFHGGRNEGIWFVKGGGETLVVKLVKFDPSTPSQLVEEQMFRKLFQELGPSITEDPKVAFPVKVFRLLGPNNVREHDLIVMKKAPGKSLSYVIGAECLRDLAGRAAKPISCTSSGKLASAWRIFTGGMVAGSAMMPESKTYCGMRKQSM
ncbi:unnamed protein product [Symbiodinium natans]|uniref:Uncharacterized protein n=1 Tax=Symbiodinium natans TaxID=878477 RepID=A0A812HAM3_9DINO|nr:unnamed protein product [Symbiodinium natans]